MSEINTYTTILKTSKTVFSIDDFALIWSDLSRETLHDKVKYLLSVNKLIRLKRGLYALPDRKVDPFELGVKVKNPSYISFYTVLAVAGLIFQYHNSIYLASTNSETLTVDQESFVYKKLSDKILFNPKGVDVKENYRIASPERAYLDILYLNPKQGFDNESLLDVDKCMELVQIYENDRLFTEVKKRLKV